MPTFLDEPFYPGGFPLPANKLFYNSNGVTVSIEEMKLKYYEQEASAEEMALLKEYVLYFIGAPFFKVDFESEAQEQYFKTQMSLDQILDLLLDAGIDPL